MFWDEYRTVLYDSLKMIEQDYFELTRSDGSRVYRERVYCYELYHHLRCRLIDRSTNCRFQGEIDKRGMLIGGVPSSRQSNPDFVYHIPGNNGKNLVVMEVKSSSSYTTKSARRDIIKLRDFTNGNGLRYDHGIFLIFGHKNSEGSERNMCKSIEGLIQDAELKPFLSSDKISIFWHKDCIGPEKEIKEIKISLNEESGKLESSLEDFPSLSGL